MTGFQGKSWAELVGLIVLVLIALAAPLYVLVAYVADAEAAEAIIEHKESGPHKEALDMRDALTSLDHDLDRVGERIEHIHELITKDLEHTRARLEALEDRNTNITSRIRVLETNVLERHQE